MPINQLTEYEKSIDMDLKLDCNGNEIKNVADPTEAQSVATKNYVDNLAGGGGGNGGAGVTTGSTRTQQQGASGGSVDFETIYEDENIALYMNKSSEAYTLQGLVKPPYYGTFVGNVLFDCRAEGSAWIGQDSSFMNATETQLRTSPYTNRIAQLTGPETNGKLITHIFNQTLHTDSYEIITLKGDSDTGIITHLIHKFSPN
jgi:hypothetical protein